MEIIPDEMQLAPGRPPQSKAVADLPPYTMCKTALQGSLRKILRRIVTRCLPLLLLGVHPTFGGSPAKAPDNVATQFVIVPNEDENVVGFGFTVPFMSGSRDLLVYHPSEFLPAMSLGGYVEKIAFRLDESIRGGQLRTYDITGVEIRMSTSSSLATVVPDLQFSKNIGADDTFVFGRSSLHFRSVAAASGPNPFDLMITLDRPFFYDPSKGSLAIDIRSYGDQVPTGDGPLRLDSAGPEFGTDQVFIDGNVTQEFGGGFGSAPVMKIFFSPVPEPRPVLLAAVAASFILCSNIRKK